jgi:hypothetical protein
MTELADLLVSLNVDFHIYADDTQLWFSFKDSDEENNTRCLISEVFSNIETFMQSHHLKLNANKTVFLPISRRTKTFNPLELKHGCVIPPAESTRNLGVVLDNQLTFNPHVC